MDQILVSNDRPSGLENSRDGILDLQRFPQLYLSVVRNWDMHHAMQNAKTKNALKRNIMFQYDSLDPCGFKLLVFVTPGAGEDLLLFFYCFMRHVDETNFGPTLTAFRAEAEQEWGQRFTVESRSESPCHGKVPPLSANPMGGGLFDEGKRSASGSSSSIHLMSHDQTSRGRKRCGKRFDPLDQVYFADDLSKLSVLLTIAVCFILGIIVGAYLHNDLEHWAFLVHYTRQDGEPLSKPASCERPHWK